jgi:hypothetical protein
VFPPNNAIKSDEPDLGLLIARKNMTSMTRTVTVAGLVAALLSSCHAAPTVLESRLEPGVKLSYQQVSKPK